MNCYVESTNSTASKPLSASLKLEIIKLNACAITKQTSAISNSYLWHPGASEPKNMAYMSRLGIWGPGTPFKEFSDFIQAVERR